MKWLTPQDFIRGLNSLLLLLLLLLFSPGIKPVKRSFNLIYIIMVVLASLILLVLLLIFLVVLVALALRKWRRSQLEKHTYSEIGSAVDPPYETMAPALQETPEVEVIPNESYGLVESQRGSVTYDSVNVTIKQSYKNLAITLP